MGSVLLKAGVLFVELFDELLRLFFCFGLFNASISIGSRTTKGIYFM
jgi:hypothetical protein